MVFFFRKNLQNKDLPKSLQAEYASIREKFKHKLNEDGKLTKEGVKAGFKDLKSRWPAYRAQRAFQVADKNGDGYISDSELEKLVEYAMDCYKGKLKNN